MLKRPIGFVLLAAVLFASSSGSAQTFYDAGFGSLPAAQGWFYYSLPLASAQAMSNGAARLDTSAMSQIQAGYSLTSPLPLNRAAGFSLLFTAQIHSETHANNDRAGFSVIAITEDQRGIELGFWADRVFAQADSPLFTQAESAVLDPGTGFRNYTLTVRRTNYVLRVDGTPLLSGPVRDYRGFTGLIDPYETPNFLFFGDDTTSASAVFSLRAIALVTPPVVRMPATGVLNWSGLSNQTYRVETSTDLSNWITAGAVTSAHSMFVFTNADTIAAKFFRVVCP